MNSLRCTRCGTPRDTDDNFCRRCGHQFTVNLPANLPMIRPFTSIVRVPAIRSSLLGSVAVLAVGTGLEWLARRAAGSASRAAGRALIGRDATPVSHAAAPADDVTVNEVVYVRRVQLRR